MAKRKSYNVNDGTMVLTLTPAEKGWYMVTSPMDPEIVTQARTVEEAFYMARDARKTLDDAAAARNRRQSANGDSSPIKSPLRKPRGRSRNARKKSAAAV